MANAFYADHDGPLLLLTLDPGRIGADIRWEPVPGHADPFPHIYGPIPVAAVIRAVRWNPARPGSSPSEPAWPLLPIPPDRP